MTVVGMHVPRRKERKNKETVMNGSTVDEEPSLPCCCDPILKPIKRFSSTRDDNNDELCFKTGFGEYNMIN